MCRIRVKSGSGLGVGKSPVESISYSRNLITIHMYLNK